VLRVLRGLISNTEKRYTTKYTKSTKGVSECSLPALHQSQDQGKDFIYRLIDIVNILALRNASGIVVLSQTMKNVILKKVYVFLTAHFPALLPLNGRCDNLTAIESAKD
jgi:hypothetical protein